MIWFIVGFAFIMALIIIGCICIFWSIFVYNRISRLAMGRELAWQKIIKLLGRRFEMLPTLVRAIQGSPACKDPSLAGLGLSHKYVLAARSINSRVVSENILAVNLPVFSNLREKYDDLRENADLDKALEDLSTLNAEIEEEMNRFNEVADLYNTSLTRFPAPLFAARMGYVRASLFGDPLPEQVAQAMATIASGRAAAQAEPAPAQSIEPTAAQSTEE